jgi:hypothetical protein
MPNANVQRQSDVDFLLGGGVVLGALLGADMNVTTDQSITIRSAKYIVRRVVCYDASVSLTTAAGGIYTLAAKAGVALVPAAQVYAGLTAAAKWLDLALDASAGTDYLTATTLFLSLTTAQGGAATADFLVIGDALT